MKLLQVRKHMTVEQQIDTFVQGIQCVTAQSIVVNLAGDPAIWTSFEVYYNAVASTLELLLPLTHTPTNRESRNVNEFGFGKYKAPYKAETQGILNLGKFLVKATLIRILFQRIRDILCISGNP